MNEYFNPDIKILIVDCVRLGKFWNMPDLSAPYWRFYWNSEEGASVWLDGQEHPLIPQDIILIPPNTHFSSVSRGDPRHFYIHFTASQPFADLPPQVIRISPGEEIRRIIREVVKLVSVDEPEALGLSVSVMMLILYALRSVPVNFAMGEKLDRRISSAMKMINENISRPPSNEVIAGKLSMSTNAFLRLFRENAGMGPQLYSRIRRIEKACILLHYSDLDIKQIASETGFCDRFHFSRVFKKLRNVGPSEFRRRLTL
jgi:AraC-like DNA-binding protein